MEKRMNIDIFEDMKNIVGCTFISDLKYCSDKVLDKINKCSLESYPQHQIQDFAEYVFGDRSKENIKISYENL